VYLLGGHIFWVNEEKYILELSWILINIILLSTLAIKDLKWLWLLTCSLISKLVHCLMWHTEDYVYDLYTVTDEMIVEESPYCYPLWVFCLYLFNPVPYSCWLTLLCIVNSEFKLMMNIFMMGLTIQIMKLTAQMVFPFVFSHLYP
jgi:hypothetical protein